ncbi:serine/threonine protein kinase [Nonomuraea sp. NN258]|uniref:serine/threonine-protein kinase n=1 Tax=Nonomuraea antri TaxID=2730852 RepID=UPI00156A6C92|nr:serine/threonine-protein kinase [Nonomuraea antri]NRQ36538.1 serine/threonine protein kinase [Nonomuraea antri]
MSDRKRDGRRIAGRYQLQEPIGKGGMGIVWRAHDELLDRTVAVKEVRYAAALGDEVQLLNRRTMREARAAARFEHPNVIVVHDVIEEDGRPWIVMQLVQSRSLGAVIKQDGPLKPKRVAEIGLAVLDALHRAHESGVLHRDVKPENVLLADDGRVVLTDFGIATLETETQLTVTGLAGTPAFIAPERLKGLPARRESDLWSLGATLYTAVEGRSPHERGNALATMHAVLTDEPDRAPHAGPLTDVIDGLLAKEPVQRLSYEETGRLLRRAIADAEPRPTAMLPAQSPRDLLIREPAEDDTPTDPDLAPLAGLAQEASKSPSKAQKPQKTPKPPKTTPAPPAELPETGLRLTVARERPEPVTAETVEGVGRSGRKLTPIIAVGAAVVLVAGVGGYLGLRSAPGGDASGSQPAIEVTTSASPSASEPAPSDEPSEDEPSAKPSETSSDPAGSLPDGWKMYKDKTGFSVGLPKGWKEYRRSGPQVYFRGPGAASNAFLMIEEAKNPGDDPYGDWKKQERTAKYGFGGYKKISIKKVDYMKAAADWDFTWNTNTGKTRVRNRGFITDNGRGYAIYWHNLNSRWKKDLHFFETFAATFKPAK